MVRPVPEASPMPRSIRPGKRLAKMPEILGDVVWHDPTGRLGPGLSHFGCSPDHHSRRSSELTQEHRGLAFLPRTGAWRIARDGSTMRSLAEERLRRVTNLEVRSVSWFVGVASVCSVDDMEDRNELRS